MIKKPNNACNLLEWDKLSCKIEIVIQVQNNYSKGEFAFSYDKGYEESPCWKAQNCCHDEISQLVE